MIEGAPAPPFAAAGIAQQYGPSRHKWHPNSPSHLETASLRALTFLIPRYRSQKLEARQESHHDLPTENYSLCQGSSPGRRKPPPPSLSKVRRHHVCSLGKASCARRRLLAIFVTGLPCFLFFRHLFLKIHTSEIGSFCVSVFSPCLPTCFYYAATTTAPFLSCTQLAHKNRGRGKTGPLNVRNRGVKQKEKGVKKKKAIRLQINV